MIEFKDVTKEYSKGIAALNGVNLKIEKGEFAFIVGGQRFREIHADPFTVKGAGSDQRQHYCQRSELKSSETQEDSTVPETSGVVFQDFRLLKDRNIYENIAFALRVTETSPRIIKQKVPAALSLVGLAQKYKAFPKELSGGEQQGWRSQERLSMSRRFFLADEPTGNLDPTNSWEIMKLLEEANERGTTVLVVTHNQEIVNEMKKRVITMKKGVIVSDEQKGGYNNEN